MHSPPASVTGRREVMPRTFSWRSPRMDSVGEKMPEPRNKSGRLLPPCEPTRVVRRPSLFIRGRRSCLLCRAKNVFFLRAEFVRLRAFSLVLEAVHQLCGQVQNDLAGSAVAVLGDHASPDQGVEVELAQDVYHSPTCYGAHPCSVAECSAGAVGLSRANGVSLRVSNRADDTRHRCLELGGRCT
jgi:hypothetical protein